jgi:hypothetical protein
MRVHVWATITGVMGSVGAALVMLLTVQTGAPVVLAGVLWSLAVLLAGLGVYSAWAMLGGKM